MRQPALLRTNSFSSMLAQSEPPTWVDSAGWYGFGLFVQPQPVGVNWDHGGYNPGSKAYFYRFANGTGFAFLFNGEAADGNSVSAYAAQAIANVLFSTADWPDHDLFPLHYPPRIAPSGVVNAASFQPGPAAPGSLITIMGADLGGQSAAVSVFLREDGGAEHPLPLLYSGPGQLNCVLPDDIVPAGATLIVRREGWPDAATPWLSLPCRPACSH